MPSSRDDLDTMFFGLCVLCNLHASILVGVASSSIAGSLCFPRRPDSPPRWPSALLALARTLFVHPNSLFPQPAWSCETLVLVVVVSIAPSRLFLFACLRADRHDRALRHSRKHASTGVRVLIDDSRSSRRGHAVAAQKQMRVSRCPRKRPRLARTQALARCVLGGVTCPAQAVMKAHPGCVRSTSRT